MMIIIVYMYVFGWMKSKLELNGYFNGILILMFGSPFKMESLFTLIKELSFHYKNKGIAIPFIYHTKITIVTPRFTIVTPKITIAFEKLFLSFQELLLSHRSIAEEDWE